MRRFCLVILGNWFLLALCCPVFAAETDVQKTKESSSAVSALWTDTELNNGYVVFEHNPMLKLAVSHVPARSAIVKDVACSLARGEYESLQIAVHALVDDVQDIRIEVESDLDVTVYHRISPSVKQELAQGEMSWISWMDSGVYLQRGDIVEHLAKGQSVNFWLTFHADPKSSAGPHIGEIWIKPANRPATRIDLKALVRPFQLQTARAAFGMYYREDNLPKRFGGLSVSDQVTHSIYRDMAAYGQNSVTFYGGGDFSRLPPKNSRLLNSLKLAMEARLVYAGVPCLVLQSNIATIEKEQRKALVTWLGAQRSTKGWPEIVTYGWDEPPYPAPGLRETYLPMRDESIRSGTAMGPTAAYAYGDVHDVWIVIGGHITPEMQAEATRLGAQVWTYSYRIWREGFRPLPQRYYAGLYTWAHKLGGNFIWAYSDGHHGHVWWAPGDDEPMPTVAWEARREGVDDYRYLQMVEDCALAKKNNPLAVEAAGWLEALRARLAATDPHKIEVGTPLEIDEYDDIRAKAADYIEKLGAASHRFDPWPVSNLKDEASAFRGKSVDECIAGLGSHEPSKRRSAASALFELGPHAAPAVDRLAEALDDPEVRIAALRALEKIGPEAYRAVPQVASLLTHIDSFVRLSATYALVGIARPESWNADVQGYAPDDASPYAHTVVAPLRLALGDSEEEIVLAAALGLFCCGEAAGPALPDALELFEREEGRFRQAGLRVLSGLGPAGTDAIGRLVEVYEAAEGEEPRIAQTLAAFGPKASGAVSVLERYRTPENKFLADTCYALYSIRGGEADLQTMARLLGDKSRPRGNASQEWKDAARFLIALGVQATPVSPLVRERIPLLKREPTLQGHLELMFERIKERHGSLRILPR